MDRSWIFLPDRFSQAYVDGVDSFIEFAKAHLGEGVEIKCPCTNCRNYYKNEYNTVKTHLLVRGMMVSYTTWLLHGELPQTDEQGDSEDENDDDGGNDYEQLIGDHYKGTYMDSDNIGREDMRNFEQLLEAAQRSLYPGCNDTLLSFVIEMLQVKVEHGWSNTSFNKFLSRITKFLPEGHVVPQSMHECKKLLRDLGLGYEVIDACPNDCVLFWKENAPLDKCPKCGRSRYKVDVKCQSLYANWKTKLYEHYKELKEKHEKEGGPDPKTCPLYPCNPDDWVLMIDYVWQTRDWEKKSKRGKKARKGLKYNHTSGSQSFVARASMQVKDPKKGKQTFPDIFKETHIRHRQGSEVWINDKAKKHHAEMVKMIEEQSHPDVTNPLSEEQVSVEVLGKRSGYLKGYGIRRSRLGTQSQGVPNSEVVALKQQVADQGKFMVEQGKVIADYGKKFDKLMLMLASGVNPATIAGLIQGSENEDSTSGGTSTS